MVATMVMVTLRAGAEARPPSGAHARKDSHASISEGAALRALGLLLLRASKQIALRNITWRQYASFHPQETCLFFSKERRGKFLLGRFLWPILWWLLLSGIKSDIIDNAFDVLGIPPSLQAQS